MDLKARKHKFIQKVFTLNESLFEKLENVLKKETEEPKRISIEQYNKELDESIKQIKRGEFYTQEEVKKRIDKMAKGKIMNVETIKNEEQINWWNELSKEEREEIETGLSEADKGNYVENEQVMKRFNR